MRDDYKFTVRDTTIRLFGQSAATSSNVKTPALILLHGAGGNLDFWTSRLGPHLREAGIALYAPHYFDRTQTVRADLKTINDGVHTPKWLDTIEEALAFVAERPDVDPNRIVLAGISLGAFLALALASELSARQDPAEQRRVRAIVEISGGLIHPYAAQATAAFPPTLILYGAEDEIVPVTHAIDLDRRLTELDVAHRTELLQGEGHWFGAFSSPRMLRAVSSFLEEHLDLRADRTRAM